jgi:hypothetical protein
MLSTQRKVSQLATLKGEDKLLKREKYAEYRKREKYASSQDVTKVKPTSNGGIKFDLRQ